MSTLTEPASSGIDDELNISLYIQPLRRRWLLVAICGIVGLVLALGLSYLIPKVYAASVELAIVRTGTLVNFDPKFRTISDNDPNAQGLDQVSRRRSLVTIGDTPAFAALLIKKMGSQLPQELQDPYELQRHINVSNDGDIIRTAVGGDSPELVANIANTWADLYQQRVNQTFSENALSTDALMTQVDQAQTRYDTGEAALTTFQQTNPYERLRRDQDVLSVKLNRIGDLDVKLKGLQDDAGSLKSLLSKSTGDITTSDTLAALLLEINTFNSLSDTPFRFDVSANGATAPATRAQQIQAVDDLIKTIQERRSSLYGKERDDMLVQLNTIHAQIEQNVSRTRQLEASRDLAWSTLQLLHSKVAENNVITQTASQLVRLATPAIPPTEPVNTRRPIWAVLGALAGLVVGSALALLVSSR